MSFRTFIPVDILKPFVKSFAISENESAGSYEVLPGTSIVMGFQYTGRLSLSGNGETVPLSLAGVTGLMDSHKIFSNIAHTGTILVNFSETGAAAFFNTPMHELFNTSLSLDDLMLCSQMDIVAEQLNEAKTDTARIAIVEKFLVSRLDHKKHDGLVDAAVALIRQHQGNIKITALCEQLHISQSRFEKRFRSIVGASPKKFASIVRLRTLLTNPSKGSNLTQLGLEAGYFDQAHFIKDFKSFTGKTPEQFFGKK